MFLNAASPRRSFSIPININLHGTRRWQTRPRELHTAVAKDQEWSRRPDGRGGQTAQTQRPVSSVGEDRAILLGFAMMAFSVLMFFVVGITTVKPYLNSCWKEISCVLLQTQILEEQVDCRGVSTVQCLMATVNLTGSNQEAFLHFDEESVLLATEMERKQLEEEVKKVKSSLDSQLGSNFSCFIDKGRHQGHPNHTILQQKYTLRAVLLGLRWPGLMLGGGALLIGLVKLTQRVAHLSSRLSSGPAGGRLTSTYAQDKLYRLLRRSST